MPKYRVRITIKEPTKGMEITTYDEVTADRCCHKDAGQLEFYIGDDMTDIYPKGSWHRCTKIQ